MSTTDISAAERVDTPTSEKKVAFALGGLAGSNAWGAGFLHTALEEKISPILISCTSGQIYWVYKYLQARAGKPLNGVTNLKDLLIQQIKELEPYYYPGGVKNLDLDYMKLCIYGIPHKFHVPWGDNIFSAVSELAMSIPDAFVEAIKRKDVFLMKEMMTIWPSAFLEPDFPQSMFDDIAETFIKSDIGIFFNSYHPQRGEEYVHMNPAAVKIFNAAGKSYGGMPFQVYRKRTVVEQINSQAIRNALWLIFYGPPESQRPIDAAYHRQIMLRELVPADAIFVVRPTCFHWHGPLPNRFLDMLDFLTEEFFNGIYAGEREQIVTMNELRKKIPALRTSPSYHHIDLWEVEPDDPSIAQGFFDYVFERVELFDKACDRSRLIFSDFLKGNSPPP